MIIRNSYKILLLLFIFIIYKYKTIKFTPINTKSYDIIYNTGGYYGFYQLGICHYIKNNFNYKNKTVLGISAGAWLAIFMSLDHSKSNEYLQNLFKQTNPTVNIRKLPKLLHKIAIETPNKDFNLSNINIAVTELCNSKMIIHNNFLSIDELSRCATASSFIPFITYNDAIYFYKHKLIFDGGLFKKLYMNNIDTTNTLSISFNMFNRFKKKLFGSFIKPKKSFYQLYILGYHDAQKNHAYFEKYFIHPRTLL